MSKAEDVKFFFEQHKQKEKFSTWNDFVNKMNALKIYIDKEKKEMPMQYNSPMIVKFTDGSEVYVEDPMGSQNAFYITLPNQE